MSHVCHEETKKKSCQQNKFNDYHYGVQHGFRLYWMGLCHYDLEARVSVEDETCHDKQEAGVSVEDGTLS